MGIKNNFGFTEDDVLALISNYEKYIKGEISLLTLFGISDLGNEAEVKARCRYIYKMIHPDTWPDGTSVKDLLGTTYSSKIGDLLGGIKDIATSSGNVNSVEYFLFEFEKKVRINSITKFLDKDDKFEYGALDSKVQKLVRDAITFIGSLKFGQERELKSFYSVVVGKIEGEYRAFYESFIKSNFIVVSNIDIKDRPTYRESLREFANKLSKIKSKYTFSKVLKDKLNKILDFKKRGSIYICCIESVLKSYVSEISGRPLSQEESSLDFRTVSLARISEFNERVFNAVNTYKYIKDKINSLNGVFKVLRYCSKDNELKSRVSELLLNLELKLKKISSFDEVDKEIKEVTSLLEKMRFDSRVVPKIFRGFKEFETRESAKCDGLEKQTYYFSVLARVANICSSWLSKGNLLSDLLVDLFKDIDINNREKTDRVLTFLSYSNSGIYIRRKEGVSSGRDGNGFYVLEYDKLNNSDFLIYQIGVSGSVSSCPIKAQDLFEFYLPLDELVFLKLKYYFKLGDSEKFVLVDDIINGYFILKDDDGYDVVVGDNDGAFSSESILNIDDNVRIVVFEKISEFIRGKLDKCRSSNLSFKK